MTDAKLKALKDLPVPPAREAARKAALAAAMVAFDATGAEEAAEKTSGPPQDSDASVRLFSAPHSGVRRKLMSLTRLQYGMAASVAALMIAAPIGLHLSRLTPLRGDDQASRGPESRLTDARLKDDSGGTLGRMAEQAPAKPLITERGGEARSAPKSGRAVAPVVSPGEGGRLAGRRRDGQNEVAVAGVPAPPAPPAATTPTAAGFADKVASEQRSTLGGLMTKDAEGRIAAYAPPRPEPVPATVEEHRDQFQSVADNPVKQVAAEPVSTFSLDVDTASYSLVRRALNSGRLPQKDAVRVEEMINYFPYDYAPPESADVPFRPNVSVLPAPWNPAHQLVHIAIKGYELKSAERPRANLVFLLDVSGSMSPEDRLPLVKNAFRLLLDELKPDDTVGIVTYAAGSGVALEPTKVSEKAKILAAIDRLGAGGSTAGAAGITDAYRLAEANFDTKAVNRIILATDGDFNVGISSRDELKGFIERKRDKGIYLSILGVGHGNYNDALMQALAQNGNGTAAYVDTLNEARKVLVDEASSTLFPIAKDVKIQVEFNPALVSEYRLVGYETRVLKREDFNNDKVDAGEVGSGHTVTAIYEVTPKGSAPAADPLRYAAKEPAAADARPAEPTSELGFLKMRYKLPKEETSRSISVPITRALEKPSVADTPTDARFSVAVAAFGQLLRGSAYLKSYSYDDVIALAQGAKGADPYGYRAEFVNLVRLARSARP
jgi:Ca-activated chloride channel family protein